MKLILLIARDLFAALTHCLFVEKFMITILLQFLDVQQVKINVNNSMILFGLVKEILLKTQWKVV
jgi:hypothetical protein